MLDNKLSFQDRMGLAYHRLNNWEWDDIFGEKPEGFDDMPNFAKPRLFGKRKPCKYDYISAATAVIREVCPMAEYYSIKFRDPPDLRTEVEWFGLHGQLRLVSILAKRGVKP